MTRINVFKTSAPLAKFFIVFGVIFTSIGILPAISEGTMIADLVAIIGSIDIVLGEVDR